MFATAFSSEAAFRFKYFMYMSPELPLGKRKKAHKQTNKQHQQNPKHTHHVLIFFLKSFPGGAEETSCERQTCKFSVDSLLRYEKTTNS